MKIIGRKTEKKELENCEKSNKSELVCVYGRRRVGKTFLVEQTYGDYFAFRATGLEKGNTRQQLKAFNQRLIESGDEVKTIPKNWFEAFSRLDKLLSGEQIRRSPHNKKIVFLDEFPWFATQKSDFLLAFEDFWNRKGTQHGDLLFVICGSATSWIIKNVLDDSGSMFHRVTMQIFVAPFTLSESEQFFADRDFGWAREQVMECQMVFGGLPFFMELMNTDESFRQNVDRLLFSTNALLKDETSRLLEATLKKSPVYSQVLEKLSFHSCGMKKADCQIELNVPTGTFARTIEDLEKCGYIIEYKRHYEKGNPLYIQLADPFLLFHYHFLSKGKELSSYDELTNDTGLFTNWRGHAFELLCLHHIDRIK
jgi:predicted AAA+ superfamily ATPase